MLRYGWIFASVWDLSCFDRSMEVVDMSRQIEKALAAWRAASREWESVPRQADVVARLARAWLDYQVAVASIAADEIVLVTDDDGCYVAATPNVETYLGIKPEVLLGMTIADITPPEDRPDAAAAWTTFLKHGFASGKFTLSRPDGREVRVLFRAKANSPARGLHVSHLVPAAEWSRQAATADAAASAIGRAQARISDSRALLLELRGTAPAPLDPRSRRPCASSIAQTRQA
jgi:PAS domain S-box-containing protein